MWRVAGIWVAVPRERQAARGVVEAHSRRIEVGWVVAARQPAARVLVDRPCHDLREGMHPAAVLRWASPRAVDTAWVAQREIALQHIDERDRVLPVVAEIVRVARDWI